jgi:DNA-binding MarR family transcriptional regulator
MPNRKNLIEEINSAGRRLSTVTVIFHQTIAEKAGLSGADHKYLDLLFQEGAMTAGKMAELTGLTTGAITGIIDRLEKQGLVKRESDPDDRRKVLVVPQIEAATKILAPVFEQFQGDLEAYYDRFSKDDLEIVREYLISTIEFIQDKTRQLRQDDT